MMRLSSASPSFKADYVMFSFHVNQDFTLIDIQIQRRYFLPKRTVGQVQESAVDSQVTRESAT